MSQFTVCVVDQCSKHDVISGNRLDTIVEGNYMASILGELAYLQLT